MSDGECRRRENGHSAPSCHFYVCTKWLNKGKSDCLPGMPRAQNVPALLVSITLLAVFLSAPGQASAQDQAITYAETAEAVIIDTPDMVVAVSKDSPAVMIVPNEQEESVGYGVVISSAFGYNATENGLLVLEEVPYRASFEHATWYLTGVDHETVADGESVVVEMNASLNMNRRIASYDDDKDPGEQTPGIEIIENWAAATVKFSVTTYNYSARYVDVLDSPAYDVNGSTEVKFDILIEMNEDIYAQDLAMDIGLMMMEDYTFLPTSMPEQYVFHGYQDDGVSESNPYENETDGEVQTVHEFAPRSEFKQLFAYVDGDQEESFFGWARQAEVGWADEGNELVDITTHYRTDGESLRVYLSTPVDDATTVVRHDPSLGLFGSGTDGGADVPVDILPIGSSGESILIGAAIGMLVVGAVGAYVIIRRSESEDPSDVVNLDKNRYYRKKR